MQCFQPGPDLNLLLEERRKKHAWVFQNMTWAQQLCTTLAAATILSEHILRLKTDIFLGYLRYFWCFRCRHDDEISLIECLKKRIILKWDTNLCSVEKDLGHVLASSDVDAVNVEVCRLEGHNFAQEVIRHDSQQPEVVRLARCRRVDGHDDGRGARVRRHLGREVGLDLERVFDEPEKVFGAVQRVTFQPNVEIWKKDPRCPNSVSQKQFWHKRTNSVHPEEKVARQFFSIKSVPKIKSGRRSLVAWALLVAQVVARRTMSREVSGSNLP